MKSDIVFVLENAAWPALLVDASSTILRANQAAVKTFGPALEGQSPLLGAIWSPENGATAEQFLAQTERSAASTATLKLRVKGGGTAACTATICSATIDEQKSSSSSCSWNQRQPGEAKIPGADTTLAQKQKLDCALQLARIGGAGFQQRAHQHSRLHLAAVEQGRARPSLAPFAAGSREIGGQGGGNRQ